jgi:hypothetical protein
MAASQARFIDPMLLLRTDALPEGGQWQYEVKLDRPAISSASGIVLKLKHVLPCIRLLSVVEISFSSVGAPANEDDGDVRTIIRSNLV